ncbi:MAG: single-stranded-DNA-specific exonuclease RecJ [Desulfobacterales bacterium]|nr:single-stranded-DNA-specific exonuclease RecJ [Desulfobacterales bacterium]
MKMRWDVFHCPVRLKEELSKKLDIPPLVAQLLIKRGITNPQDGEKFLSPVLHHLYNPFLMKDMDKGVDRVISALQKREQISIYGDYDADGITACALLIDFLRSLGLKPAYYIPHRLTEGYGLNPEAVKKVAAHGAKLLICVDCGISDREEIHLAQQLGMDTIVVDHHQVPPLPSPAYAVLDPLQPDCPFPFKGLAGVGVAFHLVMALRTRLRERAFWLDSAEPNLRRYLDLVALGTIADVVPLVDINRVLVMYGLKELEDTVRPGLISLKEVSHIGKEGISTGSVAFRLAPRLNAGGRVANGQKGVELLLADEYGQARGIAEELDQANRERQGIEERIYKEAKEVIERDGIFNRKSLVLSSNDWHPGVIGIVASRLAEEFWRPTILIALEGNAGKGSARSIVGFHVYEGLQECEKHLLGFGGHKYAAGLQISRDKIQAFRDGFEEAVKRKLGDADLMPTISVDAEVDLGDITPELLRHLSFFPPYGPGNPRPIFATKEKLPIRDIRILGKDTVKFALRGKQRSYEVIGFGMGTLGPQLPSEARIAFHPKVNDWQGVKRLQLELRDVETDNEG